MDRRYKAVCLGNSLKESKEKGTPSVCLSFQTEFEYGDPETPLKKRFFADLWLTEKTFDRTMDTLTNVLGWSGNDLFELNVDTLKLAGVECDITTGEETYNNQVREKVKFINPIKSVISLDEMAAANLTQKMQAKIELYRQKNRGKVTPTIVKKELHESSGDCALNEDGLPF